MSSSSSTNQVKASQSRDSTLKSEHSTPAKCGDQRRSEADDDKATSGVAGRTAGPRGRPDREEMMTPGSTRGKRDRDDEGQAGVDDAGLREMGFAKQFALDPERARIENRIRSESR
ncbi:hypothetical protein Scep_017234 [Stephania cephalantha]|uniref:Uncharacterized protein n=1 Tax=Stephania cephalantha TaxID=152367 RepID=A0AAP0NWQ1_9MAGN